MNPPTRMRLGTCLCLLSTVIAGCGDNRSSNSSTAGSRNPATAPLDYLAVQGQAKKHSEGVVALAQIQQALQQFRTTEERWPESLQELVKAGLIARVPTAPAGQRMDYDPRTGTVRISR